MYAQVASGPTGEGSALQDSSLPLSDATLQVQIVTRASAAPKKYENYLLTR